MRLCYYSINSEQNWRKKVAIMPNPPYRDVQERTHLGKLFRCTLDPTLASSFPLFERCACNFHNPIPPSPPFSWRCRAPLKPHLRDRFPFCLSSHFFCLSFPLLNSFKLPHHLNARLHGLFLLLSNEPYGAGGVWPLWRTSFGEQFASIFRCADSAASR